MTERKQVEVGTVVQATLRSEDLIPAFFAELLALNPDRAEEVLHREANFPVGLYIIAEREIPEELRDQASEMVYELQDALDDEAPEGMYFGTLEGDASDFGFWPVAWGGQE
jgi:hypothetical protein